MRKRFRRFELLLPTKFNSGLPVPDGAFADTLLELEERFGAVSSESQTILGQWRHEGLVYRDESVRIFVDVPDADETREFFIDYKEILKKRFQQIDIWMTTFPLEVL
jgi:hypothetical protein